MPHLIFQTKFPMHEQMAEISFFGSIERETMEALQQSTFATLQSTSQKTPQSAAPVGVWRASLYSGHVVHFLMNLPGDWAWRQTVQNILRVAWMDIFERTGWTLVSMWNANASASNSALNGLLAAHSDKNGISSLPPPPPPPLPPAGGEDPAAEVPSAAQKEEASKKQKADDAQAPAPEVEEAPAIATANAASTRDASSSKPGALSAADAGAGAGPGQNDEAVGNDGKGDGGGQGGKEKEDVNKESSAQFKGECTNFLLFKSMTPSSAPVRGMIAPQPSSLDASFFLSGVNPQSSATAAQQLMLASLPWLQAHAAGTVSTPASNGHTNSASGGGIKHKGGAKASATSKTDAVAASSPEASLLHAASKALKDTAATAAALDASPPKAAPHGDEEGAAAASKEVQAADGMDRVEVLKRSHSKDKDKGVEASAPAAESSGGKRKGDADADSVPASKKRKEKEGTGKETAGKDEAKGKKSK